MSQEQKDLIKVLLGENEVKKVSVYQPIPPRRTLYGVVWSLGALVTQCLLLLLHYYTLPGFLWQDCDLEVLGLDYDSGPHPGLVGDTALEFASASWRRSRAWRRAELAGRSWPIRP